MDDLQITLNDKQAKFSKLLFYQQTRNLLAPVTEAINKAGNDYQVFVSDRLASIPGAKAQLSEAIVIAPSALSANCLKRPPTRYQTIWNAVPIANRRWTGSTLAKTVSRQLFGARCRRPSAAALTSWPN